MKILRFFRSSKNTQEFSSKKFQKVVNDAVRFLYKSKHHHFPATKFPGCGVYILNYNGNFYENFGFDSIYLPQPIYVGKAVPKGWRNGRSNKDGSSFNLYRRIQEHSDSIKQASNLNIEDFCFKYVVLDPDLIVPVEAKIIRHFKPLWNCVIDGFGNHNPGINRLNQAKSDWDILHPGRLWANEMKNSSNEELIVARIERFVK